MIRSIEVMKYGIRSAEYLIRFHPKFILNAFLLKKVTKKNHYRIWHCNN